MGLSPSIFSGDKQDAIERKFALEATGLSPMNFGPV